MDGENESTERSGKGTKVGRVAETYGLDDVEAELLERRRGERGERESLRALESYFNRRVLRAALERAGERPLEGEVENVYHLLTADEVTEGTRTEARRRLERDGVDVGAVEADFVSYQTINRFLDAHPEGVTPKADEASVRGRMERLFKLESRLSAVASSTLERLRDDPTFTLGEFDVFVGVTVTCTDCHARRTLRELLRHDGCEC